MIYKLADKLHVLRKHVNVWQKKRSIFSRNPRLKNIGLSPALVAAYKELWRFFGIPSPDWLKMYIGVNGNRDAYYVPEWLYYTQIEPRLNNTLYALAYADKNFYEKLCPKQRHLFPKVYLRKINSMFYNDRYTPLSSTQARHIFEAITMPELVLKPASESAGGRNVAVLKKIKHQWQNNGDKIDFQRIDNQYASNFILQEKIDQHSFFKTLNPSSVNTVRMFTYRSVKDNSVHVQHAVHRFGQTGSVVDNQASGGWSIGIKPDGAFNDFAINKYGQTTKAVNGCALKDLKTVPYYELMKETAQMLAPHFVYHRLLAFDLCVDAKETVRVLEVNVQNIEINFLQMNNGPLFGEFTDEIIEFCQKTQKSVNFDFYV